MSGAVGRISGTAFYLAVVASPAVVAAEARPVFLAFGAPSATEDVARRPAVARLALADPSLIGVTNCRAIHASGNIQFDELTTLPTATTLIPYQNPAILFPAESSIS